MRRREWEAAEGLRKASMKLIRLSFGFLMSLFSMERDMPVQGLVPFAALSTSAGLIAVMSLCRIVSF